MKNSVTYYLKITIAMLLVPISVACAWTLQQDKRNLPTFSKVSIGVPATVYLKQGNSQSVVLEGDNDVIEKIVTEVKGGKLIIKNESNWGWNWGSSKKATIYITMKDLEALSLGGSGKVIGESKFNTSDLKIAVSGSGNIQLDANAKNVEAKVSGSGSIKLRGKSVNNSVKISGSGSLNALDMEVDTYEIAISGSGSCKINVKEEIDSKISGSGSVRYKGNPSKVNNSSSGSGRISKI